MPHHAKVMVNESFITRFFFSFSCLMPHVFFLYAYHLIVSPHSNCSVRAGFNHALPSFCRSFFINFINPSLLHPSIPLTRVHVMLTAWQHGLCSKLGLVSVRLEWRKVITNVMAISWLYVLYIRSLVQSPFEFLWTTTCLRGNVILPPLPIFSSHTYFWV